MGLVSIALSLAVRGRLFESVVSATFGLAEYGLIKLLTVTLPVRSDYGLFRFLPCLGFAFGSTIGVGSLVGTVLTDSRDCLVRVLTNSSPERVNLPDLSLGTRVRRSARVSWRTCLARPGLLTVPRMNAGPSSLSDFPD